MPVRADLLAQKLASAAGYQLSLTENGRRVHHRIRLLGGVTEDSLANQPAVRAVVRQVLQSPYGAKTESLVATAGKNMSRWPGNSRRRRGYKDYPAQVIGTLAERGILQPLACLKCPSCASTIRVTPSELGAPVRCELCSASVPFGSYIANSPERPAAWATHPRARPAVLAGPAAHPDRRDQHRADLARHPPRARPYPPGHLHRPGRHLPEAHRAVQARPRPVRPARHHPAQADPRAGRSRRPVTRTSPAQPLEKRPRTAATSMPAGQTHDPAL